MLKKRLGAEAIGKGWNSVIKLRLFYKIPTTLIIPKGVEEIPYGCFKWCYNLREVTIPEGVWGIGGNAFYECWNLKKVVIPESVESIGEFAFDGCEKAEVILRKSIKDIDIGTYAFNDCKKIKYYRKK